MSTKNYKVGQLVRVHTDRIYNDKTIPNEVYTIIRIKPGKEYKYVIERVNDGVIPYGVLGKNRLVLISKQEEPELFL